MEELIQNFKNCNIIVIAGRDDKILNKLGAYSLYENVKVIGWTDQMPNFIKASDIVLTKAGGATVNGTYRSRKAHDHHFYHRPPRKGQRRTRKRYKLGSVETPENHK